MNQYKVPILAMILILNYTVAFAGGGGLECSFMVINSSPHTLNVCVFNGDDTMKKIPADTLSIAPKNREMLGCDHKTCDVYAGFHDNKQCSEVSHWDKKNRFVKLDQCKNIRF